MPGNLHCLGNTPCKYPGSLPGILSDEILRQNAKLSIVSACGPDNKSFSVSISPLSTSESIWARSTAQQRLTPSKLQSGVPRKDNACAINGKGNP